MSDLVPVHFVSGSTWQVGPGWLNLDLVVAVRPWSLDLEAALCHECAKKVRVPPVLGVRLLSGEKYLVLGDGRSPDGAAVRLARRLLKVRARCEREQHLDCEVDYSPEVVRRVTAARAAGR